jgi:hypothetical protein
MIIVEFIQPKYQKHFLKIIISKHYYGHNVHLILIRLNLWFLLKHTLLFETITTENFYNPIINILNEIEYEHIFNMISSMPIKICKILKIMVIMIIN